ncbi:diaminopimelate decarboxylase [Peptostreptococcaceae bacterium OttesenSCG-928-C18]|nr:diaminopimelate decarboxylase [Peptostreptococcaceae bacterium OttesenSCG-928-C18]
MKNQEFIKENAPCYIYKEKEIIEQCKKLKKHLSGFEFLYSIKANPFKEVIKTISAEGFGADAASVHEVFLAKENGINLEQIFYSTPGKTDEDISNSFGECIIIADSFFDIIRINKLALSSNKIVKIGIRINPDFSMKDNKGVSSKFGIDIEQINDLENILLECENIQVVGIHIHIQSQILNFQILGNYYLNCFEIAKRINKIKNIKIEFINFGSGIGTIYDKNKDNPVNLEKLAKITESVVNENRNTLKAKLYIESGRFLVCNSGKYYTNIVDIKISHGKKYLVVQNGINGFLRPSIANLIQTITGEETISSYEPLYTTKKAFSFNVLNNSQEKETVTIVGNLCTSLDVLAENIELNTTKIGDIIEISNAGSYGYSLSPLLFASHKKPKQFYEYIRGDFR